MPEFVVLDTETCGFGGGVVEIAGVVVNIHRMEIEDWHSSLVRPDRPIEYEAMATHHITEEMVAGARPIEHVIDDAGIYSVADVLGAHNAPFDSGVLPAEFAARNLIGSTNGTQSWVCTHRCALHVFPRAPRFSNQVLRYWLGLDVSDMPSEAGGMAHRALYDAWVTAKLALRLLEERSLDQLIELSGTPITQEICGFGKHRGKAWENIDRGYLRWVLSSDIDDPDVLHTVRGLLS